MKSIKISLIAGVFILAALSLINLTLKDKFIRFISGGEPVYSGKIN